MGEKLTPQQQQAVNSRGGRLLVSAAAGSGKTKVLVDRLLGYLNDPAEPANLDDFLIITYTKAAAAELRGKIAAKLTERIAAEPENRHLQRQLQRLYLAKISTVHSFCADVLRQYAYQLDIAGDFRVADENECRQLRDGCVEKLLERAYDRVDQLPDFRAFVDSQGLGRDDRQVPEIILQVYDSARCHLDPEQWLENCVRNADMTCVTDAAQTVWGRWLMQRLFAFLDQQIEALTLCGEKASQAEGLEKPAALLADTVYQLRKLRESGSWDEVVRNQYVDFGRLVFPKKGGDPELAERIKAVREACKDGLKKQLRSFADDSEQVLADMRSAAQAVRGIVALVREFGADYGSLKRSRRIMDFGDLEHRMLDLLLGRSRSGLTSAAREIGMRFREVMVDEYQDSNAVQDAIFMALTEEKQNCFMVGDVKQSIYQFRLADPEIFLRKYEAYKPEDAAAVGEGRKVLLSSNFRSGGGVIQGVNDVFSLCMTPEVGGLHYTEAEALREGVPHIPLDEPEVELYALDVQENTYAEEAAFTAQRIAQLLDGTHKIRQGDETRPIQPEDIAILLRSPGSVGHHYRMALENRGIRCTTGGGDDLLQTGEIAALRAVLQIISNPRQDIPLLAALASPVFGYTADDLAAFRAKQKKGSLYDALLLDESPKSAAFLKTLSVLRRQRQMQNLTQLLETVLLLTGMEGIYGAMPDGDVRRKNLQTFFQLAADFENGGRRDLEQFLEHLQAMEEKGLIAAGEQSAAGAVTLMSIHKSKGLEFPVVFVCGLSREFNRESARAQVLCHKTLGLGLSAVDEKNRVRYSTIAKRAIAAKITADSLSEELRVLYVALTRARDRLIMTYASNNLEKDLKDLALRMDINSREQLCSDAVCPGEWVLMSALRRTEAGELFALGAKPEETHPGSPAWHIQVVKAPKSGSGTGLAEEHQGMPADAEEMLRAQLEFRYGHPEAVAAPSKQTATQRKGREKDAEAAEHTQQSNLGRSWRKPAFRQQTLDGREFGNVLHEVMQHIRYEACTDIQAVQRELTRLVAEGFITEQHAAMADSKMLWEFFQTELGTKLRQCRQVLREFKFSILDSGENYDPALKEEEILLQGVVDCALVEPDGITVVDFKTDRVTEETLDEVAERYRPQVQTYAEAMERIWKLPVKAALLYFFRVGKFVSVK